MVLAHFEHLERNNSCDTTRYYVNKLCATLFVSEPIYGWSIVAPLFLALVEAGEKEVQ